MCSVEGLNYPRIICFNPPSAVADPGGGKGQLPPPRPPPKTPKKEENRQKRITLKTQAVNSTR